MSKGRNELFDALLVRQYIGAPIGTPLIFKLFLAFFFLFDELFLMAEGASVSHKYDGL
jgi:hypothetical protein